jgi:uncharacterized SAM-binding protein YcdF (DUF218 family)
MSAARSGGQVGKASAGRAGRIAAGLSVGALAGLLADDLELAAMLSFWLDSSWAVPACALVFGAGWCTPLRKALAAAAAAVACLWLAVAYSPLVARAADGLVRRDTLAAGDAVFVFAASMQRDGEPTAATTARLLRGIELVAAGRAARLVVSDLVDYPPSTPVALRWVAAFAARPVEVVSIGAIRNTREEALALAKLCRERGWRRVLAVTSPVHTTRACGALERAGLDVVCAPSLETRYDLETLQEARDRRNAFAPILHERIGLLVYRRRGWVR